MFEMSNKKKNIIGNKSGQSLKQPDRFECVTNLLRSKPLFYQSIIGNHSSKSPKESNLGYANSCGHSFYISTSTSLIMDWQFLGIRRELRGGACNRRHSLLFRLPIKPVHKKKPQRPLSPVRVLNNIHWCPHFIIFWTRRSKFRFLSSLQCVKDKIISKVLNLISNDSLYSYRVSFLSSLQCVKDKIISKGVEINIKRLTIMLICFTQN